MNISNQIQIIYIPWWIKIIVTIVILISITVCGYLFYNALHDVNKSNWLAAGAYLLGIVFPILIIVLVVGGSSFGERSIIKRTERMLVKTIPYHLQFIPEETRVFRDFRKFKLAAQTPKEQLAKITMFYSKGRCYADYRISVPDTDFFQKLELRVELNIKRANVNVSLKIDYLKDLMKKENFAGSELKFLRSKFSHTLEVERKQAVERDIASATGANTIAYDFSENLLTRKVDGENYLVIVATTALADDTVWNPSEAVFFAQDLMFMIRAFLQECPDIFIEDNK